MSTLSELLPAGGGANNTDFVASGAIASGKPVILNSAGTVTEVAETAIAAAIYDEQGVIDGTQYSMDWCYDTVNNKVVYIFRTSANSGYPVYCIGTIANNAITWTTPSVIYSQTVGSVSVCYNTTEDRIVFFAQYSSAHKAISGTSDGSSITWGSVVTPGALGPTSWSYNNLVEVPGTSKVVWAAGGGNDNYNGYARVGTLSGSGGSATSSWGTGAVFNTGSSYSGYYAKITQMCYDHGVGNQVIITHGRGSSDVRAVAGAISGTDITFGTPVVAFNGGLGQYPNALDYDTGNNKALMVYGAGTTGGNATETFSRVISTTGSAITLGPQTDFKGTDSQGHLQWGYGFVNSLTYIPHLSNFVFCYVNRYEEDAYVTTVRIGHGATNIWSNNHTVVVAGEVPDGNFVPAYDPDTELTVLCYRSRNHGGGYLRSQVFRVPGSTSNLTATNLLGISSDAISNSATGTINTWGSVNEVQSGLTIGSDYYVQDDGRMATGIEYSPYSISNANYDSKSFSVASQESTGEGLAFNTDGTKMYALGLGSDTVYEYDLSTAFDISTIAYNSVSFSIASQETTPGGLDFSADGTKMYIAGYTNDTVFQYTLSTAWDLSTASYASLSFSVSSQEDGLMFVVFNPTGSKMYIRGFTNETFYQYSLSTPYNVSTASYDSVSFSPTAQGSQPISLAFNADGTKCFVANGNTDAIFQYSLSTAYNIGTASYDSISLDISSQDNQPKDIAFSADGTKLFFIGQQNNTVYQYSTTALAYSTTFKIGQAISATQINIKDHTG